MLIGSDPVTILQKGMDSPMIPKLFLRVSFYRRTVPLSDLTFFSPKHIYPHHLLYKWGRNDIQNLELFFKYVVN